VPADAGTLEEAFLEFYADGEGPKAARRDAEPPSTAEPRS